MLTQQYIKELLYQHECVTVPNFGAFLTRSMNILIDTDSGLFLPPRKEVSFNSLLSNNDGVLAHYIAQKEKVSFEQALRRIEKEVRAQRRCETGTKPRRRQGSKGPQQSGPVDY